MSHSDLELRLLNRLRARGTPAVALGIDLGTTKSCVAYAHFDPEAGTLACECLRFPQVDGTRRVAVPSVVAVDGERTLFGAEALAQRGRREMRVERNLFYETKNLIGLRYTYARAPKGFRTPTEVSTQFLRYLRDGVDNPIVRKAKFPGVVTVPASFHGAQRKATLHAAVQAFEGTGYKNAIHLLDEPYAAFVDLKFRCPEKADSLLREGANVLVFDFGGGTCDVAIFRVDTVRGGALGARLLGTSRYHRLGGGDIDRAIVHDVLIPELLQQNDLDRFAMSWDDKRRLIEPQLLGLAERLKIVLSHRMSSHQTAELDITDDMDGRSVGVSVDWKDKTLKLDNPSLSVAQLRTLMKSFLDPDPPPEAGDEFVQRSSMFAPIVQALLRARLDPEDIHGILLCGSSSLLPSVQEALAKKFPDADHVMLGDAEELQGAVARGAALQALSLQAFGEPLVAPVCSAELSLRVASGSVPLMRAGDAVPNASKSATLLRPPRNSELLPTDIAVEVIADGQRLVGRTLWNLPAPVTTSDRLALDWRMDDNQCVELRLSRLDHPDTEPFTHRFDAPIMHRDPGQLVRCRMLEREEAIRNDEIARSDYAETFEQHARDCASLGEYQKALHFVSLAMQEKGATQYLLNLRGIYREKIGDRDGAIDSYVEAGEWSITRFNAGLLFWRNDNFEEALSAVDSAIELDPSRSGHALRGDILRKMGRGDEARVEWQDAIAGTPDLSRLDDFDLGWMEFAARNLDEPTLLERIREQRKLKANATVIGVRQGELPEIAESDPVASHGRVA